MALIHDGIIGWWWDGTNWQPAQCSAVQLTRAQDPQPQTVAWTPAVGSVMHQWYHFSCYLSSSFLFAFSFYFTFFFLFPSHSPTPSCCLLPGPLPLFAPAALAQSIHRTDPCHHPDTVIIRIMLMKMTVIVDCAIFIMILILILLPLYQVQMKGFLDTARTHIYCPGPEIVKIESWIFLLLFQMLIGSHIEHH